MVRTIDTKDFDELMKQLALYNEPGFNIRKAIEENVELNLELIQRLNKPDRNNTNDIAKELGDVIIRLSFIMDMFGIHKKVEDRVEYKTKYLLKRLKEKKYNNI